MGKLSCIFLVVGLLFLPGLSVGQDEVPRIPANQDIRIIVDISGSMKTTDPENLRQPAVRLLARLLPDDTTAGVWTFGQYVNMLVPHGKVTDGWREQAIDSSSKINSVALRTNLGKALEVASDGYYTHDDLSNTHFILLTDGKVDVSEETAANEKERARILESVLSRLADAGATIHTIALSDAADLDLLEAFADQTGGSFTLANSADDLNLAFLRSLNSAAPQEQIPIEGNQFLVDEGVKEFTALIFPGTGANDTGAPLRLVTPAGVEETAIDHSADTRWASERGYDLITVTDPGAGQWRVSGALGEGSRVTVVSDLKMVLAPLPLRFTEQEPVAVEAMFYEQDTPITDQDFLGVIDVTLTITSADGRSGTKHLSPETPPEDGVYRDTIERLPFAGDFEVDVVANGKTFSRKYSQTLTFVVPEPEVEGRTERATEEPLPQMVERQSEEGQPDSQGDVAEPTSVDLPAEGNESEVSPVGNDGMVNAPIDLAEVEMPEAIAPEEDVGEGSSDWMIWAGIGGAAIGVVAAIVGFVVLRRKRTPQPEPSLSGTPLTDELVSEEEPEPEPEKVMEAEVELEEATESEPEPESLQPESSDDGSEEKIPQLEEEVAEPEDDEFGLEDFDLSEIDEFEEDPENSSSTESDGDEKADKNG